MTRLLAATPLIGLAVLLCFSSGRSQDKPTRKVMAFTNATIYTVAADKPIE